MRKGLFQVRPLAPAKAMPCLWIAVRQLQRLQLLRTYVHTKCSTCIRRGGVVDKGTEGGQKTTGQRAVPEEEESPGDNLPARYSCILQRNVLLRYCRQLTRCKHNAIVHAHTRNHSLGYPKQGACGLSTLMSKKAC